MIIIENSRIPGWLSKIAPIDIRAVTIWPFVLSKEPMDTRTKQHEMIHVAQQKELLAIPFFLLYGIFWLVGLVRYGDGHVAYRRIPFEQEAYANEMKEDYLGYRKAYNWIKYKI